MHQNERPTRGARGGRILAAIVSGTSLSALALAASCTASDPVSPTSPPVAATIQPSQTQVVSTAQSVATVDAPTARAVQTAATTAVTGKPTQSSAQANATGETLSARQATATVLAPTAQAVARMVAPTVQSEATQVVSAVGTATAMSQVHVTNVNVSPTDTVVALQNSASTSTNLAGWTLVLGSDMSIVLNDVSVSAGQTRQLHFSQGTDTPNDTFIGFGSAAARSSLQPGARVVLIAPQNQIASVYPIT
jgi:hypothetical protein